MSTSSPVAGGGAPERAASRKDVDDLLENLRATIENARSRPMSSAGVVNKSEVLGSIDALASALSSAFAASDRLVSERERVVADAHAQAGLVLAAAAREHDRLVADSEVLRVGRQAVEQLVLAAEDECRSLRRDTDQYVDGRLAHLEVSLTKTLEAVNRGRDRLQRRSELDRLDDSDDGQAFTFPE